MEKGELFNEIIYQFNLKLVIFSDMMLESFQVHNQITIE